MDNELKQVKAERDKALKKLWSLGLSPSHFDTLEKAVAGVADIVEVLRRPKHLEPDVQEAVIKHLNLVDGAALDEAKNQRDKALAACAEMRDSLEKVLDVADFIDDETGHQSAHIKHALSYDCGKGWLPPEVGKELVKALEMASEEIGPRSDTLPFLVGKALAHAKEHGIQ